MEHPWVADQALLVEGPATKNSGVSGGSRVTSPAHTRTFISNRKEDILMETPIVRRADGLNILKRILPPASEAVVELHELAMKFSTGDWKDLFIRFWQQQACSVAELEAKVRQQGGVLGNEYSHSGIQSKALEIHEDTVRYDKNLLTRCLNCHEQLVHLYRDILRSPLPFDLKMLLHRHQLQTQDTFERLTTILANYLSRTTPTLVRSEVQLSSQDTLALTTQGKFSPQPSLF
jgi:hypothetical protein